MLEKIISCIEHLVISNRYLNNLNKQFTILSTASLAIGYHHREQAHLLASHLNLTLRSGELTCLLGLNGIGKTTLMRTLTGMHAPLSGHVLLGGVNMQHLKASQLAQKVSVVLTDRVEVGNLSVYSVVAMGRYPYTSWLGRLSSADRQVIQWAIQTTGIEHLVNEPLYHLSDGERQKVMIARALAQDTPLILLDEPTVHLDLPNRMSIMRLLRKLVKEMGKTVLMSTHGLDLALQCADYIWLMHDQSIQSGVPEDLVLKGAIQQVFQKEGIKFDLASGTFRLQQFYHGTIRLTGQGPVYIWTQRALERIGYDLAPESSSVPKVEIREENNKPIWSLSYDDFTGIYPSLEKLLIQLNQSPYIDQVIRQEHE